jgi:hypothetical protein
MDLQIDLDKGSFAVPLKIFTVVACFENKGHRPSAEKKANRTLTAENVGASGICRGRRSAIKSGW